MGHNHPIVRLADVLGHVSSKPVWIRSRFEEHAFKERYPEFRDFSNPRVIIMPAFNELVGGVAFNEASYDTLLGPLFTNRAIKLEEAEAYLLDGTYLGTIKQLRSLAPRRRKLEKTGQNRKKRKFGSRGARDIVHPRD
jgi:metallophosphoesterase superfamily enzyme